MPIRVNWSEAYQRGIIYALLTGKLHVQEKGLKESWFSGYSKHLIGTAIHHKRAVGEWPDWLTLKDATQSRLQNGERELVAREVESCRQTSDSFLSYVLRTAIPALKRVALEEAAIELSEIASDGEPERFTQARLLVDEALRAGEKPSEAFRFEVGVVDRHQPDRGSESFLVAPTGIPTLDRTLEGGLRSRELGLIYGPTGIGKSHFAISFGAASLRAGLKVLHITLELSDMMAARRYDRCLTERTTEEIRTGPETFFTAWKANVQSSSDLRIYGYPRYSLSPSGVSDLLKRAMDFWGTRCLLIVDYGSILQPLSTDARHQEVGRIHEALSRLAQEFDIPIWTPYQTNRAVFFNNDSGDVRLEHAGESYEALQHADMVLGLSQNRQDEENKQIRVHTLKMREAAPCRMIVEYDWSRTTIKEKDDEGIEPQKDATTIPKD